MEALLAFAEQKLDRWHGLPPCTIADAIAVFGRPSVEQRGIFGRCLRYPARALEVWCEGDRVVLLVAFPESLPRASLEQMLGEPETRARSRIFEPSHEQWVYAARGLSAHVDRFAARATRIYGFVPMPLEDFLKSPISLVEVRELER